VRFGVVRQDDLRVGRAADAVGVAVLYRGHVNRIRALWPYVKRYIFDAAIVLCAAGGIAEMASVPAPSSAEPHVPDASLWLTVPIVLLMTLPLLTRRRWPFAAPAFVFVVGGVSSFFEGLLIPYSGPLFLAILASTFLFGMLRDRFERGAGLGIGLATVAVIGWNDPSASLGEYIAVPLIIGVVWVAAFAFSRKLDEVDAVRERALRLEREREEGAREAVAEERARLARELHDVVGHSVSVMTVQASAVRRLLLPEQEKEREALEVVEQTGRQALAEMRRLVGVLRRPEEAPTLAPQPSLEHLDKLVAHVRDSGLPVDLRVEGEPARIPAGVDLTAYRLVQEGLTNALKHARADHAQVVVRYGDGEIELEVADNGTGGGDGSGGGHGLVGMRERVAVYGGELDAAPRPEGGFRLRARLPLEAT
jgi:signal transduction histidine kinase